MSLNRSEMNVMSSKTSFQIAGEAELRPDRQRRGLALERNERLEASRDIRRRKQVGPYFVAGRFKFAFFNDPVDKETSNPINQKRNDAQLRNNPGAEKRSNARFAQNWKVLFERAIGAFGSGAQGKQLAIAFSAARDFENEARMLSNRYMGGIA